MADAADRGHMLVGLLSCVERSMAAAERAFPAVDHRARPSVRPDEAELDRVRADVRALGSGELRDRVEAWEHAEHDLRIAVERLTEMHRLEDEPDGGDREQLTERIHAVRDARVTLEELADQVRACVAKEIDAAGSVGPR